MLHVDALRSQRTPDCISFGADGTAAAQIKRQGAEMALRHPIEDLESRLPVWQAMTDFFLDTELTATAISHIAKTCAASPYSTRELRRIMFLEVWPAFLPNLLSVAGEWVGWTDQYVQERVLESYRPRIYLSWRANPLKRYFCSKWATVEKQVWHARNGSDRHTPSRIAP